jgi:hypothetical protein
VIAASAAISALLLGAAAPALHVPPWPLAADGDVVATAPGVPLEAEGALLVPLAPGLHRVVPLPGAREVVLAAGALRRTVPVAPPPGGVEVTATPAQPVKGRDRIVALGFAVHASDGTLDQGAPPPVVSLSAGRLGPLVPDGPGRFRAEYELPAARHPEVAVIVAIVPRCPLCATPRAAGAAALPLAAGIALPGRAEPGARTTVEVGGCVFGPAVADAQGRFSVELVVPPGARTAAATSVDPLGNRKRTSLDLGLPPTDRLACAAWPRELPADGEATAGVWCLALDAAGAPQAGAHLEGRATRGALGAFEPGGGALAGALARATYRAPSGGGGREDVLEVSLRGGGPVSREAIALALATGAPARIDARLARDPVPLGAAVRAETSVRDARGDVLGAPHGPAGAPTGFVAPDRFVARREPGDWVQRAPLAFALAPGRTAATIDLRREGGAWVAAARTVDARPAEGVAVRFGSGVRGATDARGEARAPADGPEETVEADGGARAAGWDGVTPPAAETAIAREVAVPLRPRSEADVVARLEGRTLSFRVEDGDGAPIPRRRVVLRATGVTLGPVELDPDGGRCAVLGGAGRVAVVDAATGVTAVVEVR